jgi:hypothetical protein
VAGIDERANVARVEKLPAPDPAVKWMPLDEFCQGPARTADQPRGFIHAHSLAERQRVIGGYGAGDGHDDDGPGNSGVTFPLS